MKHLTPLLLLFLAAAPTTKPADPFEPYTERIPGTTVKFDMVPIPSGKFLFSPDGKITATPIDVKRFWMAKAECTWDEYDVFQLQLDLKKEDRVFRRSDATGRPSPPYSNPDHGFGHEGYPAISISAKGAAKYCEWLSAKTGKKYRLPTEAEWQYACSTGQDTFKVTLAEHAWYLDNSEDQTHPVMKKKPNPWGLYDMLGNVGEWCTPARGKVPVLRGGSYATKATDLHCRIRTPFDPKWQERDPEDPKGTWWLEDCPFAGFRVVREE